MKKILFLTLFLVLVALPLTVFAGEALDKLTESLTSTAKTIGFSIVIIGWVIAGILYLTAIGEPQKLETAKRALIACVVGTVAIALAFSGQIIDAISTALGVKQ